MAKKMQFERRLARKARRAPGDPLSQPMGPGQAQLPPGLPVGPAAPQATADLAAGGEKIARGQSSGQPMTPEGHAQISAIGADIAKGGGPSRMVSSTSRRAMESSQGVNAQQVAPVPVQPNPGLESQSMGMAEGAPKTPELKKILADLIRNRPNVRIPGQGAAGKPAETWNEFRIRGLSAARGLQQTLAQNPMEKVLVPTSTHTVKLIEAWTDAGCPDDLSVSPDTYLKEDGLKPGDVLRWAPDQDGTWHFAKMDPAKEPLSPGAIYFLLHGETATTTNPTPSAHQRARAQIVKHAMTRNWKGLHGAVKAASSMGMPEEEISTAIDEALPNAQDASGMSSPDLLATMSAAGPQKRAELRPVVQQRFAGLSGIAPDAAQALRSHLGRIGAL
jgi:hypothetical protein